MSKYTTSEGIEVEVSEGKSIGIYSAETGEMHLFSRDDGCNLEPVPGWCKRAMKEISKQSHKEELPPLPEALDDHFSGYDDSMATVSTICKFHMRTCRLLLAEVDKRLDKKCEQVLRSAEDIAQCTATGTLYDKKYLGMIKPNIIEIVRPTIREEVNKATDEYHGYVNEEFGRLQNDARYIAREEIAATTLQRNMGQERDKLWFTEKDIRLKPGGEK